MPRIGTATLETGVIQLFFNFFCQKNHDSATVNVIPAGSLSIFYILFSLPTNSQPWQGVSKSKAKGSQIEKRIRVTAVFLPSLPAAFERAGYYLDGFFSLFGSQYHVLPLSCGDLFDVTLFAVCLSRSDELWVYDQVYLWIIIESSLNSFI